MQLYRSLNNSETTKLSSPICLYSSGSNDTDLVDSETIPEQKHINCFSPFYVHTDSIKEFESKPNKVEKHTYLSSLQRDYFNQSCSLNYNIIYDQEDHLKDSTECSKVDRGMSPQSFYYTDSFKPSYNNLLNIDNRQSSDTFLKDDLSKNYYTLMNNSSYDIPSSPSFSNTTNLDHLSNQVNPLSYETSFYTRSCSNLSSYHDSDWTTESQPQKLSNSQQYSLSSFSKNIFPKSNAQYEANYLDRENLLQYNTIKNQLQNSSLYSKINTNSIYSRGSYSNPLPEQSILSYQQSIQGSDSHTSRSQNHFSSTVQTSSYPYDSMKGNYGYNPSIKDYTDCNPDDVSFEYISPEYQYYSQKNNSFSSNELSFSTHNSESRNNYSYVVSHTTPYEHLYSNTFTETTSPHRILSYTTNDLNHTKNSISNLVENSLFSSNSSIPCYSRNSQEVVIDQIIQEFTPSPDSTKNPIFDKKQFISKNSSNNIESLYTSNISSLSLSSGEMSTPKQMDVPLSSISNIPSSTSSTKEFNSPSQRSSSPSNFSSESGNNTDTSSSSCHTENQVNKDLNKPNEEKNISKKSTKKKGKDSSSVRVELQELIAKSKPRKENKIVSLKMIPLTEEEIKAKQQEQQKKEEASKNESTKNNTSSKRSKRKRSKNNIALKVDIEKIKKDEDNRTTLMICNIPNSFTQGTVLKIINNYIENKYDFFYLPIDFRTQCNLGYAYINCSCLEGVIELYNSFDNKRWPNTPSLKTCEICYARIQGQEQMMEHSKEWAVMNLPEQFRPLFYYPVTEIIDGKEVTSMKQMNTEEIKKIIKE